MPLRYILKQLLLPPGGFLLALLAGWILRKRRPRLARCCFICGFAGLWLMSLPLTVEWSARALETDPPLAEATWSRLAERAQAIVVLGGGREMADPAWGGDQPGLLAQERLRYAARLARSSGLPLITSGGLHFGAPPSEAALMAQVLERDHAVAVRWQEGQSRTTEENAQQVALLLKAEGISRVIVVTQAWHMPRARWCFEKAGLQVLAAPAGYLGVPNGRPLGGWLPEARAIWQNSLLFNEALGWLGYRLFYAPS